MAPENPDENQTRKEQQQQTYEELKKQMEDKPYDHQPGQ